MVRNGALNRLGAISPLLEETNHFSTPLAENGRCIALVIDTASVVVLALGEGVRAAEDSRSGMQSS